jgi:ABC-type multidrug transport system ATPase subunit
MVNGHKTRLSYGKSAYVTQDEVLIAMLTVRETIMYAARLRLAGDSALHDRVTDGVIADLGLTEVAHTLIGNFFIRGISGGQRKRVGIGCELVVSPTLLFLDEPTSGLDAAAAFHVMNVVHQLCTVKNRCALLHPSCRSRA